MPSRYPAVKCENRSMVAGHTAAAKRSVAVTTTVPAVG